MGCCGSREGTTVGTAPVDATSGAAPADKADPFADKKSKLSLAQQATVQKFDNLNQEEVLYLVELFNKYDADKSESIDSKELKPLMKEFGVELSAKAAKQLLLKTKGNVKNPSVTLDDFLKMMTPYVRKKVGALMTTTANLNSFELMVMKREFSRADADGSGFIDDRELAAIIKVKQDQAREYIKQFHEGDGNLLNFNEFVHLKIHLKGPGVGNVATPPASG